MNDPGTLEALLDPAAAAPIVNRSEFTLKRWRREGCGPAFCVVNGRPLYSPASLRDFISKRTVASSPEARARELLAPLAEVTAP